MEQPPLCVVFKMACLSVQRPRDHVYKSTQLQRMLRNIHYKSTMALYSSQYKQARRLTTSQGISEALSSLLKFLNQKIAAAGITLASAASDIYNGFSKIWNVCLEAGQILCEKMRDAFTATQGAIIAFFSYLSSSAAENWNNCLAWFRALNWGRDDKDPELESAIERAAKLELDQAISASNGTEAQSFLTQVVSFPEVFAAFIVSACNATATILSNLDRGASTVVTALAGLSTVFQSISQAPNLIKGYGFLKQIIDWIYFKITGKHCFSTCATVADFMDYYSKCNNHIKYLESLKNPPRGKILEASRDYKNFCELYRRAIVIDPTVSSSYKTMYEAVQKHLDVWSTANSAGERIKPIVVCCKGVSATGKTTTVKNLQDDIYPLLSRYLAKYKHFADLPTFRLHAADPSVRVLNCANKKHPYDDGYANQVFYQFNEYLTNKSNTVNDEWANHFFACIDSEPLPLNFAFGDKGKRFFDSPFVFATGNFDRHLINLQDPTAYHRRIELDLEVTKRVDPRPGVAWDCELHSAYKITPECLAILRSSNAPIVTGKQIGRAHV